MNQLKDSRKHQHYFKDVTHLSEVDVYRIAALFNITDQCIGHALKKLLVAGGRGAGKDISKDIAEAIDSLQRWQEMRAEDAERPVQFGDRRSGIEERVIARPAGHPTWPDTQSANQARPVPYASYPPLDKDFLKGTEA